MYYQLGQKGKSESGKYIYLNVMIYKKKDIKKRKFDNQMKNIGINNQERLEEINKNKFKLIV